MVAMVAMVAMVYSNGSNGSNDTGDTGVAPSDNLRLIAAERDSLMVNYTEQNRRRNVTTVIVQYSKRETKWCSLKTHCTA